MSKSKRNVSKQKGVRKLPQVKEILHYPKMKMMHLDLQTNKKVLRKKTENENIWQCRDCADERDEDGDDRCIVCDVCNQPYHLHCSGIQYSISEYWNIQLDEIDFECEECERVLHDN